MCVCIYIPATRGVITIFGPCALPLWECWKVHGIASEAHFQLFIFAPTGRPSLFGAGRRVRRAAEVKIKSRCGSPQSQCVPTTWLCLWECWEVHGIASEAHFQLFIFAPTGRPSGRHKCRARQSLAPNSWPRARWSLPAPRVTPTVSRPPGISLAACSAISRCEWYRRGVNERC